MDFKKRKIEEIKEDKDSESFHGLFRLYDKDKDGEIIRLYENPRNFKYDGNKEYAQHIYNKIGGNLDNLKTLNYDTYKYYDYGHISNLFDKMKSNKNELLCFETPLKYLCSDKTSIFSSNFIIDGNLLFLDFKEDIIIESGGIEYNLSERDGFPIYSIHFMTSQMKYYNKDVLVKCWIASNAFYNLFTTNTNEKIHRTNKFGCCRFMIGQIEN